MTVGIVRNSLKNISECDIINMYVIFESEVNCREIYY